jgi:hypothetical protein
LPAGGRRAKIQTISEPKGPRPALPPPCPAPACWLLPCPGSSICGSGHGLGLVHRLVQPWQQDLLISVLKLQSLGPGLDPQRPQLAGADPLQLGPAALPTPLDLEPTSWSTGVKVAVETI